MLAVSHNPFACSGGRLPLRRVVWLRRVRCPETACQWWKGLAPNLPVSGKRCAAVPVCRENASQPEHPVPSALQTRVVVLCFGNWKLSDLSNCLWSCCIALPLSLVLLIHVVLQSQRKKTHQHPDHKRRESVFLGVTQVHTLELRGKSALKL